MHMKTVDGGLVVMESARGRGEPPRVGVLSQILRLLIDQKEGEAVS